MTRNGLYLVWKSVRDTEMLSKYVNSHSLKLNKKETGEFNKVG